MKLPKAPTSTFEKCPEGNHIAVCYEVLDLGTQEMNFQGEVKHKHMIWIGWETPDEQMDDGRPYVIGKRYTLSSHEKSTLRKHLESWRGKRFTDDELESFDIANLIGAGCLLNVVHSENDGRTYANIEAVARLPKGTTAPPLVNDATYLSLEPDAFDANVFAGLSERMQETIAQSPEYHSLVAEPTPSRAGVTNPGESSLDRMHQGDDESPF